MLRNFNQTHSFPVTVQLAAEEARVAEVAKK